MSHSLFESHVRILAVAVVLGMILGCTRQTEGPDDGGQKRETVLSKMLRTKRLTVGYAGYPPYLRRDPNTGEISGYSVEVIKSILEPIDVKIEWRETTWDNMKQDILIGKFDLMVEPIFMTIPRSSQVGFTRPYAYFGYAVPVVRKGEKRFKTMQDLNSPQVTIAITQGVTDQEYAGKHLPKAKVKLIPGNDITITLTEVLTGKVDAALADVPTTVEFLKAHAGKVDALFLKDPPATTPAAFMARQSEVEFISFLNNALLFLETQGLFDQLENKYSLPSFREKKTFIAGKGIPQ